MQKIRFASRKLLRVSKTNNILIKIAARILTMPKVKQSFRKIQAFYDKQAKFGDTDWLDIEESFKEADSKALESVIKPLIKEKIMVAEIGSWKGFSTSVLAKVVAPYHGSVFAVDHWQGNEGVWNVEVARTQDVYSVFKRNMTVLGVWDVVHPMVMDSQTASQIFADKILDLVFLDADHRYAEFKKDVSYWLPKLRDGGILCGHDCEGYYAHYSEEQKKVINENIGIDFIRGMGCHPGVVKGLYDLFNDKYTIIPNSLVWYHVKTTI